MQAPSVSKLGLGVMFFGGLLGGTMPVAGRACPAGVRAAVAVPPWTPMAVPPPGDPRSIRRVGLDEVRGGYVAAATAAGAATVRTAAVSVATRTPLPHRRRRVGPVRAGRGRVCPFAINSCMPRPPSVQAARLHDLPSMVGRLGPRCEPRSDCLYPTSRRPYVAVARLGANSLPGSRVCTTPHRPGPGGARGWVRRSFRIERGTRDKGRMVRPRRAHFARVRAGSEVAERVPHRPQRRCAEREQRLVEAPVGVPRAPSRLRLVPQLEDLELAPRIAPVGRVKCGAPGF